MHKVPKRTVSNFPEKHQAFSKVSVSLSYVIQLEIKEYENGKRKQESRSTWHR